MSTPHQRLYIRTLMCELDIPTDVVGDDLVRTAEAAGIKGHPIMVAGRRVDEALRALDVLQARELAHVLLSGDAAA